LKRSSSFIIRTCFLSLLSSALLLAVQPAPAQLPTLGDGSEMSLAVERKLGDRIAREIYRDPDYVDDPLLDDYVQGIWGPLQAAARARGEMSQEMEERFAWRLLLIRERSVNAFALPGGYMGVHLGLIAVVASRDELASVLGHELSHITQRHISRLTTQQGQQAPWMIAAMVLGALAASKSPNMANAVIAGSQAAAVQSSLNFSRDMEREADRIGYNVMTQAGYQPQAFVSMFEKLQQASRLNDNGAYPYLRSHPLTSQRIADVQLRVSSEAAARVASTPLAPLALPALTAQVTTLNATQLSADLTHSMMAARARILSDPGVDALRTWATEADDNANIKPSLDAHTASTPGQLSAQARQVGTLYSAVLASMKLREFAQAQRLLVRLHNAVRFDASAVRLVRLLAVELALQSGDLAIAENQINPAATDRPELFLLAQVALLQHKKALERVIPVRMQERLPERLSIGASSARIADRNTITPLADVLQSLEVWVMAHPQDAGAWQQIANVAGAQNLTLRALRAEAEVQAAYLDFPAAVDRFRAAQDFAARRDLGSQPGDHIEASIIDTRLRQMQATVKELAKEQAKR